MERLISPFEYYLLSFIIAVLFIIGLVTLIKYLWERLQ